MTDPSPRYITIGAGCRHLILDRWNSSVPVASGLSRAGAEAICAAWNLEHDAWLAEAV